MDIKSIRRIAVRMLGVGEKKVWMDPEKTQKISEAITANDIRELISQGTIAKNRPNMQSRGRARRLQEKHSKGRKKGKGKRTGTKSARMGKKGLWIKKVRALRKKLKELREEGILGEKGQYKKYYKLVKGNFFRGKKQLEQVIKGEK